MRIGLMTNESNVVRFPVERRAPPTMQLLREIAPDVRQVLYLSESFDIAFPALDLRQQTDRQIADYILNHVRPEPGTQRRDELEAMMAPMVQRAVQGCRLAHDAALAATEAQLRLVSAQTSGGYWLAPLEERAEMLTTQAAWCLVEAHGWAEEAEGAARAIGMALRGESWMPFDLHAEADQLFFPRQRTA